MTKRILIGKFPESSSAYGLRISKAGYDVASNPVNNENLIFNSDWLATLPIYMTGAASPSGSTVTASYSSLGYVPYCVAIANIAGRGNAMFQTATDYTSRSKAVTIVTNVDASPVYELAWDGDVYDMVQIKAYSDYISIYCSTSATVYWTVYGVRAF